MVGSQSSTSPPEVAIVGWIPQIASMPGSLPGGYAGCPSPWLFALQALFASGNPDPLISSDMDFQSLVASKEFRVAVALRDISVRWDDPSGRGIISYHPDIHLGYTPMNAWFPTSQGWRKINVAGYSPGVGSHDTREICTASSCTVRLFARFKISGWLNIMQAILTGHLAPSAILDLEYTVYRDGSVEIISSGSLLPSQNLYVDWRLRSSTDMLINNAQEIRDFITAGNCTDAPAYILNTFSQ